MDVGDESDRLEMAGDKNVGERRTEENSSRQPVNEQAGNYESQSRPGSEAIGQAAITLAAKDADMFSGEKVELDELPVASGAGSVLGAKQIGEETGMTASPAANDTDRYKPRSESCRQTPTEVSLSWMLVLFGPQPAKTRLRVKFFKFFFHIFHIYDICRLQKHQKKLMCTSPDLCLARHSTPWCNSKMHPTEKINYQVFKATVTSSAKAYAMQVDT